MTIFQSLVIMISFSALIVSVITLAYNMSQKK
ncbi:MAG TPA: putative holin-like toxin [Sporosarcina sp.]|nr:putative holin-like toxin [Sporosarcina sp.]